MTDESKKGPAVLYQGKMVTDPAELPPELRPLLEDADGDGIPDLAQQGPGNRPVFVDGKLYRNIGEVPPEMRKDVEAALSDDPSAKLTTKLAIRREVGSNHPPEIELDGRIYKSVDEVPAEFREKVRLALEEERTSPIEPMLDGVPAEMRETVRRALEEERKSPPKAIAAGPSQPPFTIKINSREYTSLDEVPSEHRERIRQAMEKFSVPGSPAATDSERSRQTATSAAPDHFSSPSIQPRSSRGTSWWLLFLAAAVGALCLYFALRH
jgi:hypothetical protein